MTRKGSASRVQEKMSRLRHTSTDDEQLRVESRCEVGQALAEPFPCVLHELHASTVTLARQLTHQSPGDQAHVPTHGLVQGLCHRRAGLHQSPGLPGQSVSTGVLLPTTLVPTLAALSTRHPGPVSALS